MISLYMKLIDSCRAGCLGCLGLLLLECCYSLNSSAQIHFSVREFTAPLIKSVDLTDELKEFNQNLRVLEELLIKRLGKD